MSSEKDIFAECGSETTFSKQTFLVDPKGLIVNTIPPTTDKNIDGVNEVRYEVSEVLPNGFNYIGRYRSELERSAQALSRRIKKPRF